jgi:dihydroorotase-like cyclic amidohydrolase
MNYVLIRNGKIVYADGIQTADVLIGNNKILEVAQGIARPDPETPVIDATGKYVLPGAIDINRSFSNFGLEMNEQMEKLGRSEVIGGTTCMFEILEAKSQMDCLEGIGLSKMRSKQSLIDFGFHLSALGWPLFSDRQMDYCYAHEGISSFYINWPLSRAGKMDDFGLLLEQAKKLDLLLIVDIPFPEANGSGYLGSFLRHEDTIISHLNHLQGALDLIADVGCEACFLNICFQEELDLILKAQRKHSVFAELALPCFIGEGMEFIVDERSMLSGIPVGDMLNYIPHELLISLLKDDQFLVARPSLRVVGLDDTANAQVFNRPDEFFVLKNALSVIYTLAVESGQLSMMEFYKLVYERPARLLGIYPKKGVLRSGADADIVVWDPDVDKNLYCSYPQKSHHEFKSSKLKGRAQFVFVNGVMAYDGEVFYPEKLKGSFVYRNPVSMLD